MRYKNLLFDLDGTLTDSGEGIINSGIYAFEQLGLEIPDASELRKMIGPPLRTSFPMLGVPEEQVEEAIRLYRVQYNDRGGKFENSVYPGIEEMLCTLKEAGARLYVATSKPETMAREILAAFKMDSYFEYIAGASLDHSRESKSDVLRYLLELTGSTEDTVMIGDTKYDVIGANEHKLPCIGVEWGYGTVEELQEFGAEKIVGSPAELCKYIC